VIQAITSLEAVYVASGAVLLVFAGFTLFDRSNSSRIGSALFWALFGLTFALGGVLPAWAMGLIVVGMAALDGLGFVRSGRHEEAPPEERARHADRFGWKIFLPVLMIPAITYVSSSLPWGAGISADRIVYVSLGYASVAAGVVAWLLTRARPLALVHEGRRLADAVGPVVILPQLLASLGTLFTAAGVGKAIAKIVSGVIPTDSPLAVALACCLTIAAFTFVMGNSFAALPIIMSGLGIPLLVEGLHVDPAAVGLILLTGASCGTLCTPMAANFNMVPAALFEMRNSYGVVKFQAPYAVAMFVVHVALLWLLAVKAL
jgi:uncharacterized membrane protein